MTHPHTNDALADDALRQVTEAPVIQGGQGRSPESLRESAIPGYVATLVCIAALCGVAVALLWGRK